MSSLDPSKSPAIADMEIIPTDMMMMKPHILILFMAISLFAFRAPLFQRSYDGQTGLQ
jgi:hypothetical protein